MKRVIGACAALLLSATPAPAQTAAAPSYAALFDEVWRTVDQNFYDPYFHGVDWKAARERHRAKLAGVKTDAEFRRLAGEMLGELKASHLYLVAPAASAAVTGHASPAVQMRTVGGQSVIWSTAEGSHARAVGLHPGERILSDAAATSGPLGSMADLRVEGCDGKARTVQVRRERAFWPPAEPSFRWASVTVKPGVKIGYLKADRFDDGSDALADAAMAALADTQGLVIDIRDNSGGNMSVLRLGSYFSEGVQPAVVLLARPYLAALGRPVTKADVLAAPRVDRAYTTEAVIKSLQDNKGGAAFYSENLGAKAYRKPVVVLIGPDSGSAADGFAWYMKTLTKARLVGAPTAGVLLSSERFPLSGGWVLVAPTAGIWKADGENVGDKAVPPHEAVTWTREDLCRGRDPDLAKALELLVR
ncbi:MAG TPA: S41 family peptidase [Caulobacteraceae bacterium]|jgi:carboxyl-terminal processing protease